MVSFAVATFRTVLLSGTHEGIPNLGFDMGGRRGELRVVMRRAGIVAACLALALTGCNRLRPKGRPIESTLVLYSDPEAYMTFRVMWHFTHEERIGIQQFQHHDSSGAASAKYLTDERDHPKADVYWSGDPVYCEILRQRGITIPYRAASPVPIAYRDPDFHWTGFAGRLRVLLVRKSLREEERPRSIRAFADPVWKGKGALPDPLSGTTRSQFAALSALWGEAETGRFWAAVRRNGTHITKSTEEAADMVASGQADFALVESDIALTRQQANKPVEIVYPDQGDQDPGIMVIPNAVAIVKGCKDVDAAGKLVEFLTSQEGERRVISFAPYEVPLQRSVAGGSVYIRRLESLKVMPIDYRVQADKIQRLESILGEGAATASNSVFAGKAESAGR